MANRYNTTRLMIYGAPGVELEYPCGGTARPGQLVKRISNGNIIVGSYVAGLALPSLVAIENTHFGKGVSDDWSMVTEEYAYVAGDRISVYHVRPGDQVYAWVGASETVAIGDPLYRSAVAGDEGCLSAIVGNVEDLFGHAEEALTTTGTHLKMRVNVN